MSKIKFISHNTPSSIDSIKMAALYFDLVEVSTYVKFFYIPEDIRDKQPRILAQKYFFEDTFFEHLRPLAMEGVVSLYKELYKENRPIMRYVEGRGNLPCMTYGDSDEINNTIMGNYDHVIIPNGLREEMNVEGKIYSVDGELRDEVKNLVLELGVSPDGNGKYLFNFSFPYFANLLRVFLENLNKGNDCLTSSDVLNNYLISYFNSRNFIAVKHKIQKELRVNPTLAFEAINLSVPNISKLSSEDILDIRLKMKDELDSFKAYMQGLQIDIENSFNDQDITAKAREIVRTKIDPALNDLSQKFAGLSLSIPSRILSEIKDPKSYSPLILSFTNQISNAYAIMISLGVMTLSGVLDHIKDSQEIKKNGLYYLLKLQNT